MDIFSPCLFQSVDCYSYLWPITVWYWVAVLIFCFFQTLRRTPRNRRQSALLMDFFINIGFALLLFYGCAALGTIWMPQGSSGDVIQVNGMFSNTDRSIMLPLNSFVDQVRYSVIFRTVVIGVIMLQVAFVRIRLFSVRRKPKKLK